MTPLMTIVRAASCIVVAFTLAACGTSDVQTSDRTSVDGVDGRPQNRRVREQTLLGDGNLFTLGGEDAGGEGAQLPVNKFLWRATLDTLSFLPLSSTDPYGGVIVTDWGAEASAPNERFKVTAYITSAVLRPQSLRVVVNRQQRADNGEWVTAPVDPETPRQLENAILTRARVIKSGELETQ